MATTILVIGPEWRDPYLPGCDEAHMLQAATRLARGQGLTTTWHDDLADLAEPTYHHSHAWPPLYSWVFTAMLRLGVDHSAAFVGLALLKAAAAVVGGYGWLRLAGRLLPAPGAWLFAAALPGLFFPANFVFTQSHLYYWAVLPFCLSRLLRGVETGSLRQIAAAGMLAALAISTRYNVAVVPAGAAAALLLTAGGLWPRVVAAAAFGAPAAAVMAVYLIYNVTCSGAATWVDELDTTFHWDNLLHREPVTAFFAFGFGLEEAIFKLKPSLRFAPFPYFLPWYLLMAAAGVIGYRLGRASIGPCRLRFLAVAALLTPAVVAMLGWLALRLDPGKGWVLIDNVRYYSEILPAVGVFWILLLCAGLSAARAPRSSAAAGVVWVVAVVVVGLTARGLFAAGRQSIRKLRDAAAKTGETLPDRIRRLIKDAPAARHRVFDTWDSITQRMVADDGIRFHKVDEEGMLERSRCSERVWVLTVMRWNWNPDTGTAEPRDGETDTAASIVEFLGLRPIGVVWDQGHLCQLFAGIVEPYAPGARGKPRRFNPEGPARPTAEQAEMQ